MVAPVLRKMKREEICCSHAPLNMVQEGTVWQHPVAMRLQLAQQPGGQLMQIFNLLDLLKGVDVAKLPAVIAAIQKFSTIKSDITTEEGLREYVKAAIDLARTGAAITETQRDDELVALLDHYLTEATALDAVSAVVSQLLRATGHESAVVVSPPMRLAVLAEDRGVPGSEYRENFSLSDVTPWVQRTIQVAQLVLAVLQRLG